MTPKATPLAMEATVRLMGIDQAAEDQLNKLH